MISEPSASLSWTLPRSRLSRQDVPGERSILEVLGTDPEHDLAALVSLERRTGRDELFGQRKALAAERAA